MVVLSSEFRTFFAKKRVLVTGAAGFLGSWISEVLIGSDAHVVCLDNLSTGRRDNLRNIKNRANIIIGDVEDANLDETYDFIFHFSSRASPEEYQKYPIETLSANSVGTIKMLELARKCDSTIIYASSSEVYGDPEVVPTPESYNGNVSPTGLRSCYDEGKRFGEAACMAYFRQARVNARIARIFNSYGPRIREDGAYARALPRFIVQALAGQPITIYGSGKQTRSFCYVTDTIRGILKLATRQDISGQVFNIGHTNELTIWDLAKLVIMATKSDSKLTFLPAVSDDPRRRCPDVQRAARILGWTAKVPLADGLRQTIDWFRDIRAYS